MPGIGKGTGDKKPQKLVRSSKKKEQPRPAKRQNAAAKARPQKVISKTKQCPTCPNYKLVGGDAPTRVEKCETIADFSYKEPVPGSAATSYQSTIDGIGTVTVPVPAVSAQPIHINSGDFNRDTLFLWFPRVAAGQLLALDTFEVGSSYMGNFSNTLTAINSSYRRWGCKPSMASLVDEREHSRVMALNGAASITTNFGNSSGKLKFKRYTERDSHLTSSELINLIRGGAHGVGTEELTGLSTLTLKPHVHNKQDCGVYTDTMLQHWTYASTQVLPGQESNSSNTIGLGLDIDSDNQPGYRASNHEHAGAHPLTGWCFTFPVISTSPMMPAPRLYFSSEVRIQRELIIDEAHLADKAREVDVEDLQRNLQHGPPVMRGNGKGNGDARHVTSARNSIYVPAASTVWKGLGAVKAVAIGAVAARAAFEL